MRREYSSVAIRECAYLGVPAVNIGSRQNGRDRGKNVIDVGYESAAIQDAIRHAVAAPRPERDLIYGDGTAGPRIADILASAPLTIEKVLAL